MMHNLLPLDHILSHFSLSYTSRFASHLKTRDRITFFLFFANFIENFFFLFPSLTPDTLHNIVLIITQTLPSEFFQLTAHRSSDKPVLSHELTS